MRSDIRICRDWETAHERPVYTLGSTCPKCGGPSANSAPAKFDPADPYGEYRRALKERRQP